VHYLLGLWSRLTVSIPFMKGDTPTHLQALVPQVFLRTIHLKTVRFPGVGSLFFRRTYLRQIFAKFVELRVGSIRQNVEEDNIDGALLPRESVCFDGQLGSTANRLALLFHRTYCLVVSVCDCLCVQFYSRV
jgi:hypothetical protein